MPNRIPLYRGLEDEDELARKEPVYVDSGAVVVADDELEAGYALEEEEDDAPQRKAPIVVDAGNVMVEEDEEVDYAAGVPRAGALTQPEPGAPAAVVGEARKEPDYSEELALPPVGTGLPPQASLEEMYRIVRAVAVQHSGDRLYSATLDDAAYAGDPAYAGRSFGLHFGLVLFTQESGRLGSVLRLMQQRDAALFDEVFGPDSLAVLQVTNAATAADRLQLVSGLPLTSPEWVRRFAAAGETEACRNAQNEEAIAGQLQPLLPIALALGLDTDRGVAMAYEAVVSRGLGGGVRWLVRASGLLLTPGQIGGALSLLGFGSLTAFQESTRWLPASPANGAGAPAETVAALLEALRARDAMPLPTSAEMQGRLVAAAQGAARSRLEALQRSAALSDASYRTA